ncbi:MAG: M81 family metallopeptidase [Buchananella hordeovulneris]|nr:M81 family metallopeptidase [Buchananella hordeovulneris]
MNNAVCTPAPKRRIAVGGIHIESSQYTPYRSGYADFTVLRGQNLLQVYPWINPAAPRGKPGPGQSNVIPLLPEVEWVPLVHARAMPGGAVSAAFFAHWWQEFEALLRAEAERGLDGLLLDIHGAMSVEGMVDAEGQIATWVRRLVGGDVIISASMDLHGNVSPALFEACDLLTCYRTAPHEDQPGTRYRAVVNMLELLESDEPWFRARVAVPILLPGEKTSTRVEPGASLYGAIPTLCGPGVRDVSLWMGFPWADEARCHTAVVACGPDRAAVEGAARALAELMWSKAEQFDFVGPAAGMEEAVAASLASGAAPFFVSDTGDNPGAGGTDTSTAVLARYLAAPSERRVLFASLHDAAAVAATYEAGLGAAVRVGAGEPAVTLEGRVAHLFTDARGGGQSAVIECGNVRVVVTSGRTQFGTAAQFEAAGAPLAQQEVVVVKIGYLEPDLAQAAADWVMALSPGAVDQDQTRLGYAHVQRPIVPLDPPTFNPELRVEVASSAR